MWTSEFAKLASWVCRLEIPKPELFKTIAGTFLQCLRAEEWTEAVIFLHAVFEWNCKFVSRLAELPKFSLQPLLVWTSLFVAVPNNLQRTKLEKKSAGFGSVSSHCSIQKSRFVFGGEVVERQEGMVRLSSEAATAHACDSRQQCLCS